MSNESVIAQFLRPPSEGGAYTDERLAMLLAHAEDGKLAFFSCCCLVGVSTAEHSLRGRTENVRDWNDHGATFGDVPMGDEVSKAFNALASSFEFDSWDAERRARLIPLIKAEMSRRESIRTQPEDSHELAMV